MDVDLPDQKARYVFPSLGDGFDAVAGSIREPHVHLKVCADVRQVADRLGPGWVLQTPNSIMDLPDLRWSGAPPPPGYRWRKVEEDGVFQLHIDGPDGLPAANGSAALVGCFAIFDKIETQPEHRRRGLARTIVNRLSALTASRGATHGLLVATTDGRALYETLGWRALGSLCTALRPVGGDTYG